MDLRTRSRCGLFPAQCRRNSLGRSSGSHCHRSFGTSTRRANGAHYHRRLHARFTDLFAALGLKTVDEWKNEVHLSLYLQGGIVPEDTLYTRHLFFRRYSSATRHVQSWLETLPDEERL